MSNTTIKVLRVSAKAEGYRREGLAFSIDTNDIPLSLLSSAQLQRLKSDSMLTCKIVEIEPGLDISPEDWAELRGKADAFEAIQALVPQDWNGTPMDYLAHLQAQYVEPKPETAEAGTPPQADAKTHANRRGK